MKNNRGFGFLATLAAVAGMLGYRRDEHAPPQLKADRSAPPSMRNTKRSCYRRHQGARECARRKAQPALCHVSNVSVLYQLRKAA